MTCPINRTMLAAALAALTACGAADHPSAAPAPGTTNGADQADATSSGDLANLEVLAPGELAPKIYAAFGEGMTMTTQGGKSIDYLQANSTNFIGSISGDPSNQYASSFSIGYFMALAGLAEVVGQNYVVAVYSGTAANDCRQPAGATAVLLALAPTLTEEEIGPLTDTMVAACKADPASAASAAVQSYSTALKTTL
jgi:hypothetical protein